MKEFHKNEYVVYANTGICIIEDICPLPFSGKGEDLLYYVLKPLSNAYSTLYIPTNNEALRSKMRSVLTKEEIDDLLVHIKDQQLPWIEEKNARTDYCRKVLSEGNQQELLLLVSCMYVKKQEREAAGKKLPFADENVLKSIENLVGQEFAFSLGIPEEKVEKYIQDRLEISRDGGNRLD